MKIAVYTAITAGKDSLKEVPVHESVDRIFFSDQLRDQLGPTAWDVRPACTLFVDLRRNARAHKMLAHQYLDGYDYSLWIDGSIRLLTSPAGLVDTYLRDAARGSQGGESVKVDKGDEDMGKVVQAAAQQIFANPDSASLKLVAWAYGCIRKGCEDEEKLLVLLKSKLGVP